MRAFGIIRTTQLCYRAGDVPTAIRLPWQFRVLCMLRFVTQRPAGHKDNGDDNFTATFTIRRRDATGSRSAFNVFCPVTRRRTEKRTRWDADEGCRQGEPPSRDAANSRSSMLQTVGGGRQLHCTSGNFIIRSEAIKHIGAETPAGYGVSSGKKISLSKRPIGGLELRLDEA